MRLSSVFLSMIFALLLAFVTTSANANIIPLTVEQRIAIADEVVAVRVKATRQELPQMGLITTTTTFEVLETFKSTGGKKGPLEVTYPGGQMGKLVMAAPGTPQFIPGQEAVLFLSDPLARLPEESRAKYNSKSPIVGSLQLVAGPLGRLSIDLSSGKQAEDGSARKGTDAVPGDAVVKGVKVKVDRKDGGVGEAPLTYGQLRVALKNLAAREESKRKTKGPQDKIAGIYGRFAVPERSDNAALRALDPLPEMAYKSDEELRQIKKQIKKLYGTSNNDGSSGLGSTDALD